MPDDLIHEDVLVWSERQSALLRRLAAGERANEAIDWENVIEEIESLGRSELRSVERLLRRAIEHLLKIVVWPQGPVEHWRNETVAFLNDARDHWAPSMRQRVGVEELYRDALRAMRDTRFDGRPPGPMPERPPFTLVDLIPLDRRASSNVDALIARLAPV